VKHSNRAPTPLVVKRNTIHLLSSEAIYACVSQAAFILAALVIFTLTDSATLAGLATAEVWGGRVLIVYRTGGLMDRIGRKSVLLIGIAVGCLALLMMGLAVVWVRLELFWLGLLVFGFGSGVTQQSRIAIMDMYSVERRREGLGYLMTASIAGSFLSPIFIEAMTPIAALFKLDHYAVVLFCASGFSSTP